MSSSSNVSPAASAQHHAHHRMDVDVSSADASASPSAPSQSPASSAPDANLNEQQLISPNFRLSRLPPTVPAQASTSSPTTIAAIPAHQNNSHLNQSSQDVHHLLNTSTSTSSPVLPSQSPLETPLSAFPSPLTNNDLKHPIRRPRASVFSSTKDLAAHYGIPQALPPAPSPRTTSASYLNDTTTPQSPDAPIFSSFLALKDGYMNMLDIKTPSNTSADSPTSYQISLEQMNKPLFGFGMGDMSDMLTSPEFRDVNDVQTTPWISPNDLDTPYSDFLTTPLLPMDEVSGEFTNLGFFPNAATDTVQPQVTEDPAVAALDFDTLYKMTTPLLGMMNSPDDLAAPLPLAKTPPTTQATIAPVPPPVPATNTRGASSRRRPGATGIRKGITPDTLLDEEAPTQSRKYVTPSATSKKAVPAVFARKRARSTAFPDEEDQLDELPPDASELDLIEQKRRQNTVAARRSRKRKLEYYQALEQGVISERAQKETWKERTTLLLGLLRGAGMNLPDFPPDPPSDPLLDNLH